MQNTDDNESNKVVSQQWQYNSGQLTADSQEVDVYSQPSSRAEQSDGVLNWSASEFVSHEKNSSWYLLLVIGSVILSVIIFFITREILSVLAILVLAIATGIYGGRQPKVLEYSINSDGIVVGQKIYSYSQFKSFSLIEGTAIPSIQFLPQKKIAVPLTIYVSPVDVDLVINSLGNHLPIEHKERDFVDKLSSKLRF